MRTRRGTGADHQRKPRHSMGRTWRQKTNARANQTSILLAKDEKGRVRLCGLMCDMRKKQKTEAPTLRTAPTPKSARPPLGVNPSGLPDGTTDNPGEKCHFSSN